MPKITITAFAVKPIGQSSMADVIRYTDKLSLTDRTKPANGFRMRLEHAKFPLDGSIYADFTKIKKYGPGHVREDAAIEDFPLSENGGFGMETSFYYGAKSKVLVLQNNQSGPQIKAIEAYLSNMDAFRLDSLGGPGLRARAGFTFVPVLTTDGMADFNKMKYIKDLEVVLETPGAPLGALAQGISLGRVASNIASSSSRFTVKFHIEKTLRRSLDMAAVKDAVTSLVGSSTAARKVSVVGGEHAQGALETLNFMDVLLRCERDIKVTGSRLDRSDRYAQLQDVHDQWVAERLV